MPRPRQLEQPGPRCDQFRIADLHALQVFPHAVQNLAVRETPLSWVVLTGLYAYKIKKPVRLDFIDAESLERRKFLCEEELRLNRRFARDLYLDVVPITRDARGLRVGGSGKVVEYAVRMHQFDAANELAAQLEKQQVTTQDVGSIAARLADAHHQAAIAATGSPHGGSMQLLAQVRGNFAALGVRLRGAQLQALGELDGWTQGELSRLEPLISRRKAAGRVRECHGDLHARNIVRWRQQWLAFDCLEFDPALRWIDVMNDAAFLFMDLVAHGRSDLAWAFLNRYLEETGDYEGLPLLRLFAVYRALVRAKVDALGADGATPQRREALLERMHARLQTARELTQPEAPALILMHGVTASGKSWLSERLVPAVPALRIRSDLERKRLAGGVTPLAQRVCGVGTGAYSQASRDCTYARLQQCAEAALEGSCTAIVDATFLEAAKRKAFRDLALRHGCGFLIVSCRADMAMLEARLKTRAQGGLDPSEATRDVLDEQLRSQQPLDGAEQRHTVLVDTSRLGAADPGIEAVRSRLRSAPG